MSLKITKGEWFVTKSSLGIHKYIECRIGRGVIQEIAVCGPAENTEESFFNAEFIAEAGTVANECGLTPRQLLEHLGSLESALESLVSLCNNSAFFSVTEEVIHAEATLERLYKSRVGETK